MTISSMTKCEMTDLITWKQKATITHLKNYTKSLYVSGLFNRQENAVF